MRRAKLTQLPETFLILLPSARQQVRARLGELLR
jgi:hypothetical protein